MFDYKTKTKITWILRSGRITRVTDLGLRQVWAKKEKTM